nr:DUF6530 family protein [uncultured Niameybacter sp.]
MEKNKNVVLKASDYDNVDGREVYSKKEKQVSIGCEDGEIFMKIQEEDKEMVLPFHRVLDLAIAASSTLEYFQEAYRYPKLYDPSNPVVKRIGLQGSGMTLEVCTENENIDMNIDELSKAISNQGDLIGERVRVLFSILEEMGY